MLITNDLGRSCMECFSSSDSLLVLLAVLVLFGAVCCSDSLRFEKALPICVCYLRDSCYAGWYVCMDCISDMARLSDSSNKRYLRSYSFIYSSKFSMYYNYSFIFCLYLIILASFFSSYLRIESTGARYPA